MAFVTRIVMGIVVCVADYVVSGGGGLDSPAAVTSSEFLTSSMSRGAVSLVSGKLWHSRQPGICPICQRVFSNKFNLKQHIINIHTTGEGIKCAACHKLCKNKWYLRRHQVTHHGAPLRRGKAEATVPHMRSRTLHRVTRL
ncbi:hypothetical protein HAZT_HAZT003583 [Hyalella azteca]|uniref:C2H2-type domain-containing protein n=1 Tax=Hyalella azteca TaxID=294128 RepID=A0A6A0HA09_HYAAZ|nr:hypothetical protein HAZT_HAZT003583 [Hyalella azteca]